MQLKKKMSKTVIAVICILIFTSISLAESSFHEIDTIELHAIIVDNAYRLEGGRKQQSCIIDARGDEEFENAHIFSAINVPYVDFEKLKYLLPKEKDALLVVYADDLRTCMNWASRALESGYTNIFIYPEGLPAWRDRHMPVAPFRTGAKDDGSSHLLQ